MHWLIYNLQDGAVTCRHCDKTFAYGGTRQQQYLDKCQKYQASLLELKKRKHEDERPINAVFDTINTFE
jgi:hypothetical protein